jgi:hypothetical protein
MMRLEVNSYASTAAAPEVVPTTALNDGSSDSSPELLPNTTRVDPLVCIAVDDDPFLRIAHTIFFEHALGAVSD